MTKDLVIHDTCEVTFEDLITKDVVGVGYAQIAGLEQTLTEDELRGGIGNKLVYMIRSAKDISLNITSATFKPEFLALLSGEKIRTFTEDVTRIAYLTVKEGATPATKEIDLPANMAALTAIRIEDVDGKQHALVPSAGVVDVSTLKAVAGDELEAYYLESVTGEGVAFKANKFPNKFKVTYRTVTYDKDKAVIDKNLWFVFDEAIPSGAFTLSLENGSPFVPEFNFRVTAPKGCNTLGRTFTTEYKEDETDC